MSKELLPQIDLPEWFVYPLDFLSAIDGGLYDIGPWQILDGDWLKVRYTGLKDRFPNRELVPFARRLDSDDVACWDKASYPAVKVVHDFAKPGWEEVFEYSSFHDWLSVARTEGEEFDW